MSENRINISNLDFDGVKSSFKEYLRGQSEFTDFDFEGSGINILLDVLAENTHYFGFYANMVANEAFLDSASNRRSIVSLAKSLGYTPQSIRAARAYVNVNFGSTQPLVGTQNIEYLPTGTSFRANVDNQLFNFTTRSPAKIEQDSDGDWVINNLEIVEGVLRSQNYVIDRNITNQKLVIPTNRADISTLVLRVQNSISDTTGFANVWNRSTEYVTLGPESRTFFVEEKEAGTFQIFFGDGIVGLQPQNGNYVTTQYLFTQGAAANGVGKTDKAGKRTFTIEGFSQASVVVVSAASGGANAEGVESIRFNAPMSYQSQNRAVTANDYRVTVASNYGSAESIYVYGGEDDDPPQYGKVFISIKPREGTILTDLEKQSIQRNIIGNRNVLGITPVVVDPDFIYMKIVSNVTYDPSRTSLTETGIESLVRNRVISYSNTQLEKFDKSFYHSAFTRYIDDGSVAILGNDTAITLQKRVGVNLNVSSSYELRFNNPIFHPEDGYKPVLSSTSFTYEDTDGTDVTAFLDDDGSGVLRVYTLENDTKRIINSSIGTINYTTGKINLVSFKPKSVSDDDAVIRIDVEPDDLNITTVRNMILLIDELDTDAITVTASQKTVISNNTNSGTAFPFST